MLLKGPDICRGFFWILHLFILNNILKPINKMIRKVRMNSRELNNLISESVKLILNETQTWPYGVDMPQFPDESGYTPGSLVKNDDYNEWLADFGQKPGVDKLRKALGIIHQAEQEAPEYAEEIKGVTEKLQQILTSMIADSEHGFYGHIE